MRHFAIGLMALGIGLAPLAAFGQDDEEREAHKLLEQMKRDQKKVAKASKEARAHAAKSAVLAIEAQDSDRGPDDLRRVLRQFSAEVGELRKMIEGLRGEGRT